jgi:hypothetical protein
MEVEVRADSLTRTIDSASGDSIRNEPHSAVFVSQIPLRAVWMAYG